MAVTPIKTPFTNMSFTPDVPTSALSASEYNYGYNVETNVRAINSVLGEEYILSEITGNVIFMTAGFRNNDVYWFISATEQGEWYAMDQNGDVTNITPTPLVGIIGSSTTFGNITGNSGSSSFGKYTNVPVYSTTGNGVGATFNISIGGNSAPYNGNVYGSLANTTTYSNIQGISGNTSVGTYTSVPDYNNLSNTALFNITINANASPYNGNTNISLHNGVGGSNYSIGSNVHVFGSYLGGSDLPNQMYFTIASNVNTSRTATITVNLGGQEYRTGDSLTIAGNTIGGLFGTNDLTFTLGGNVSTLNIGTFGANTYNANTVITASWNGSTVFLNDMVNPPMYLTGGANQIGVYGYPDPVTDETYVWNYDVTTTSSGNIIPLYSSLTAGFVRVYNSPNVGTLLFAGNLTGVVAANVSNPVGGTIQNLPTTVRWSQNFGLNSGPTTWSPTLTNIANEVEVPVRGPVIDGFALNGNFYVFSYWDCVQFSPIAYTSTSAPVFGILLTTQGRGLINENCFAIQDSTAYGLDARDIWSFNGGTFTPLGDQKVKNYFYSNLNQNYTSQIFMVNNTAKYQIEIYYPDLNSTGRCNQMISYRYDLQIWNPPRTVYEATQAAEAPRYTNNIPNLSTRGVVYSSGAGNVQLIQKDIGTSFVGSTGSNVAISSLFQRNNISYGQPYSQSIQVHRVYPEMYGTGNLTVGIGGSDNTAAPPVFNSNVQLAINPTNPWVQINQNQNRVVTLTISNTSNTSTWQVAAVNWQVTIVEADR